jgi:hypothetical protein
MSLISWPKIAICFLLLCCVTAALKYSVDTCLPYYAESNVFRSMPRPPDKLCSVFVNWDAYARARNAEVAAKSTWLVGSPGLFETDDRKTGILVFGKDILKFTIVLSKFPNDRLALSQVLTIIVILSIIISLFWQGLVFLCIKPLPSARQDELRQRRVTATRGILPQYLEDDNRYKEK